MATFEITEGAPGQGKSIYTANLTRYLVVRNKKWYQTQLDEYHKNVSLGLPAIYPQIRRVGSNLRLSSKFEEFAGEYLFYWTDTQEITKMHDCDIVWDEIATELDSRNFANLTVELKRFLSQYRKRGIDIYANTQDFSMIDARARLMITRVRTLTKIIGSPDISTTKPKPKYIWGLIMMRDVTNWKETDPEKKKYEFFPGFMLIDKDKVSLYDTRQDIPLGKPAALKHIELLCEHHDEPGHVCTFKKVVHQ